MKSHRHFAIVRILGALLILTGMFATAKAEINLPRNTKVIGVEAFQGDRSLGRVILPNGVEEIQARAFANSGLTEITLPDSLSYIDDTAFDGPGKVKILCNKDSYAYSWAMKNGYIEPDYTPASDFKYSIYNGHCSIDGYNGKSVNVFIPPEIEGNPVTSIEDCAFMWNDYVQSVVIPESVTYIGRQAFYWCSALTSVVIPDDVPFIEYQCFALCKRLRSVTIPAGVTGIENSAFEGCNGLTAVTFPASLTEVGMWAFISCQNLKSARIPSADVHIDYDAFEDCPNLTLYGVPGSDTERIAEVYEIPFVDISTT